MDKWKSVCKRLVFPPAWVTVLCTIALIILLPLVFIKGLDTSPLGYGVYVLSFYAVCILTAYSVKYLPGHYRSMKGKIYDHPLGNRYVTDASFKMTVSLTASLSINLAYSIFTLASGIYYSSLWIGSVAVYYILLSVIRFILLNQIHRKKDSGLDAEYRSYRFAAVLMLLINLILCVFVLNMILEEKAPAESDVIVITSATYTFYILSASIRDLIKFRNSPSPVMAAAKAVRFAQALVSLLSLEASMLVQFGDDESQRRLMLVLSGAAVCILVLSMSVYMIVRANKEIRHLKFKEEQHG